MGYIVPWIPILWLCLSVKKNKWCQETEICQTLLIVFAAYAFFLRFLATPLIEILKFTHTLRTGVVHNEATQTFLLKQLFYLRNQHTECTISIISRT